MIYTYAALLLNNTKQEINEANLKKVLTAAGATVDELKIKGIVAALSGVNIEEAIKQAAVVAAAPAASAAAAAPAKDEKTEEKKEEEAAAGLASLFG